jgi:poly(beta-D-mannuronate) lyase
VRDVVIAGNHFIDCDNIELCAGKDFERTATPKNVLLAGNIFYTSKSIKIFHEYDDISGISFKENYSNYPQAHTQTQVSLQLSADHYPSLKGLPKFSVTVQGLFDNKKIILEDNNTGPDWLNKEDFHKEEERKGSKIYSTPGSNTLYEVALKAKPCDTIVLSNNGAYYLSKTIDIRFPLYFTAEKGTSIEFEGERGGFSFFSIENGGSLYLSNIRFIGISKNGIAESFIRTSKQPTIEHYKLFVDGCSFLNLTDGRKHAFRAFAGSFADSIVFTNCLFHDITGEVISIAAEKEDKGYYNAENIIFKNCVFNKILMGAIDIYRGGNDESTTGPFVTIDHCTFNNVGNTELGYAVRLYGVQFSTTTNCLFNNSGKSGRAVWYEDFGWTKNLISNTNLFNSGKIQSFYNNVVKGKLENLPVKFSNEDALDFSLASSSPLKHKGTDKKDLGALYQNGSLKE